MIVVEWVINGLWLLSCVFTGWSMGELFVGLVWS